MNQNSNFPYIYNIQVVPSNVAQKYDANKNSTLRHVLVRRTTDLYTSKADCVVLVYRHYTNIKPLLISLVYNIIYRNTITVQFSTFR